MSELANQLLASVNNLAQAQSAVSTSLGDYFAKVTVLLEKIKDSDDDEIQQAITGINAAAAAVNSDGANLQAHSQALADATGTAAPTQPVPTAPSTDNPAPTEGSTPPVEGGETPSNPSGGDPTAPANDNNGADGTTISEGSQGAEDDSNAPDGSEASEGAPGSEQPAAESNNA